MKTGIEIEFWVVDERGRLSDGRALTDAHDRLEPEFVAPLVEVQTAPHEREAELRRELQSTLQTAIRAAEEYGRRLVPLGTPMTAASAPATEERGRLFETIYGDDIRGAKNCAGTHVHFEKGNVPRQLNLLTALDPALALVSSSPYYLGERLMDSSRAHAYRRRCGEGFEEFCGLWEYVEDVEEWEARVADAFDAFREIAVQCGVSVRQLEDSFTPEDAVLNPVRLHQSKPTVEWRAPDAALPSQVVRLAFDARRLVASTDERRVEVGDPGPSEDRIGVPEFSELRSLSDAAIRWGLGSADVREHLGGMGFDLTAYRPISQALCGPGRLRESEARSIRLEYARRLRQDVAFLTDRPWDGPREMSPNRYVHA